ncbi:hypothetical protein GLOIN_2v1768524 [Rhizophagus irregularis DAOM 181602=DAOM 197198]|uniref:Uncharacterized protein n=1 Tax=Rhizophagus irregularis (strain DAOM 181602 / DAOM 197198 / MUCL 43194) TaxID=747089 RepID=A0A2P4QGR6_RHIID|nr:hypothetical protein GLOIN_2v1768524 [Rhizophagus irregularis DAOM 181602=DAOM 197198]POG76831.1 hypothetical protein GLOIN_2v1768524 [Rhizophagus irregularis DAOM 181602=DAOM 197198]|eukprot:XP_025183697.1 hypothetical protein GLOIN_2v1768524 [Rhizophagus irregularis DAOM 181602=DAOM 197198]
MAPNVNFEGPGRQIMAPDFYLCLTNVINVHFFDFLGPGRRRMAPDSYFEGPGPSEITVLQFWTLETKVLQFWTLETTGSSVLDFEDDGWVLQFPDLVFQSVYPQFVSWTPNLPDSHFKGTGIRLESQFEGPQLSLKEFQNFAASSQNNWIYKIGQHCFIEKFMERTSKKAPWTELRRSMTFWIRTSL